MFTKQQKNQAARESEKIQIEFEKLNRRFERTLFSDTCPDDIFTMYNNAWIKWANEYNNNRHISLADPRAFYKQNIQE